MEWKGLEGIEREVQGSGMELKGVDGKGKAWEWKGVDGIEGAVDGSERKWKGVEGS